MSSGLHSLRDWRQVTWQLTTDLGTVGSTARKLGLSAVEQQADTLRARLLDRRFTIAVVGEFKRGKSTFINALLGDEILPADILPTTATVNRVTYGLTPGVELHFHDGRPVERVGLHALAEFVTKLTEESATTAAGVREAVVTYPVRFCKNDVDIVDTPGLGDEATMTAVTMRLLPLADAAILVVMADSPFSDTEGQFLNRLLEEGISNVIFVVSAIDRIRRAADRERVLDSVGSRIGERLRQFASTHYEQDSQEYTDFLDKMGGFQIYGVSALQALEARADHDGDGITSSGMPAFEAALEAFLTTADQVGLVRRVQQLEELCDKLLADGAPVPATPSGAAGDLDDLEQTLAVLDASVHRQRSMVTEASARYLVQARPHMERLTGRTLLAVNSVIEAHKGGLASCWPDGYEAWCDEVAQQIHDACLQPAALLGRAALDQESSELEALLAGSHRIARAVNTVLRYLESRLADQGHHRSIDLIDASHSADEEQEPDFQALAEAIVVRAADIAVVLKEPGVTSALSAYGKVSTFNRFVSLDFGGLAGAWAKEARAAVSKLIATELKACDLNAELSHWIRASIASAVVPLSTADGSLKSARLVIRGFRERQLVRVEQDQRERQDLLEQIEAVRIRAAEVRAVLASEGV